FGPEPHNWEWITHVPEYFMGHTSRHVRELDHTPPLTLSAPKCNTTTSLVTRPETFRGEVPTATSRHLRRVHGPTSSRFLPAWARPPRSLWQGCTSADGVPIPPANRLMQPPLAG